MNRADTASLELQALLAAAVDAILLIDHCGLIQLINHAGERLFGYAAEESVGHNVNLLMSERDRDQHDAYMERYLRSGVPYIIGAGREAQGRRKDGSVFPAFLTVGRIAGFDPPRFVLFIRDITVRAQALAAAQRERDRANRYLEAAQTILLALDTQHRITLLNRKGCEVLGCDDLLGADLFEALVPAGEARNHAVEFDALLRRHPRRPYRCEFPIIARGGAQRLIAWRCVVVEDANADASGILCSGDDVTETRRAESEVRETRERMLYVSRLAVMGEMASGISHELNQPLAAIANYAQAGARLLAAETPDLTDVREALEQITAQALRGGDIIRRLRSLVSNRPTEHERADINKVIEELQPLTRADAQANRMRVVLELASDLPALRLDRIQIQQVLLNLIRNAIDALAACSPEQRQIIIRTRANGAGDVVVTVADTGPGVAAKMVPQLFAPFTTTKPNGTGLGLVISRTIVEAHGGRLQYQPNEPSGAAFSLTLPIEW